MKTFKEKLYKRNRVYSGKAVGFLADDVTLPNGKRATREYIDHPGAVAVLPFLDKKNVVLVKQYRFPVGELTYEVPAGKLDAGESPLACIRRELEEETGFRAGKVKKLVSYWPTAAFSNEIIHVYLASGLVETKKNPDDDEFIDHAVVPVKKALAWVKNGKIKDSKTIVALLYWKLGQKFLKRRSP
ncbi:MAG: NUDIX hydrolase [Endomicrobiales bacterium]|nr:NUDIX hydrolase [Endomicrobiales bacterium]